MLRVLKLILKCVQEDNPPLKLPNQNWSEREKQKRRGCSAEVQFQMIPFTASYLLVCAVKLQPIVKQTIVEEKYKHVL